MIQKSDVTIVIPTLWSDRNFYAIKECLLSLKESGFPREQIIIIANNDEYRLHPGADITLKAQGQCRAVNAAVATVTTPWVMVTNDDMIYKPDWFEKLTHGLPSEVLCVSPQLVEPNDGAPTFVKYFCGGVGGDWNKRKWLEYVHEGQGLRPGFNLPFLIKKEVFELVGGYDLAYDPFGSNSDSDLEYKLKLAGIKMYQNTNCPVYHFSNTSGTFHPDNRSYWQKNWEYFIEKWGFERIGQPEIWTTYFEIPYDKLKYKPKWAILPGEKDL